MSNLAFCLMGPTATGKTDIGCELVKYFPFEIISIDSAMIYRDMDIGTAKPSASILNEVTHHLIDIIDPPQSYSVAECCADVERLCVDIINRNKIPLLLGGTMMYFNALQNGLAKLPVASSVVRQEILASAEIYGWPQMHQKLQEIDPITAARISVHDKSRIQRALEVFAVAKQPLSVLVKKEEQHHLDLNFINIALVPEDRSWLHTRINKRFLDMIDVGFVKEVQRLIVKWSMNVDCPAMRCVGYRQIFSYLRGEIDYNTMLEKACSSSRQLAKRQLTWLRKWDDCYKFKAEDPNKLALILEFVGKVLDKTG